MNLRVAVVEDDDRSARDLADHLQRYEKSRPVRFQVTRFTDGADLVDRYRSSFDLIFLDIEMLELDGMSAARKIREVDSEVMLIFVTNLAEYAIRGYEVGASDYLLKPLEEFGFGQRLDRILGRRLTENRTWIVVATKGREARFASDDLLYVEVADHQLVYHTRIGDFSTRQSLASVERNLDGDQFARCNQCFLVNLAYVESVRDGQVLVGSNWLPISRGQKRPFLEKLTNFV